MTDVFGLVDTALATLAPIPYAWDEYDTVSDQALPDTYLVASDVTDAPESHFDNQETTRFYRIQVSAYSRSGLAAMPDVNSAMQAVGFMPGNRFKLPYDHDTGHFGLAKDYTILIKQ